MSEELPGERPGPHSKTLGLRIGLGLSLVGALATVWMVLASHSARGRLGSNCERLEQEIRSLEGELAKPRRPTRLPAKKGNAVRWYQSAEWLIGPRESWIKAPKGLPKSVRTTKRPSPKTARATEKLRKHADEALKRLNAEGSLAPDKLLVKAWKRHDRALKLIRYGLSRKQCSWPIELRSGLIAEIPELVSHKLAVVLLLLRAETESPAEALRTSLDCAGIGADIGRAPVLIMTLVGVMLQRFAFQGAERALRRPGLTKSELEEALAFLDRLPKPAVERVIKAERIAGEAAIAIVAGRPLLPGLSGKSEAEKLPFFSRQLLSITMDREWRLFRTLYARLRTISLAKFGRGPASEDSFSAVDEDFENSGSLFAVMLIPSLNSILNKLSETEALRQCLRLAIGLRLEGAKGKPSRAALKKRLGAIPRDPFATKNKLHWSWGDASIRVWSVGRDHDNDKGKPADTEAFDDAGDILVTIPCR